MNASNPSTAIRDTRYESVGKICVEVVYVLWQAGLSIQTMASAFDAHPVKLNWAIDEYPRVWRRINTKPNRA